jgi:hypothetical protein
MNQRIAWIWGLVTVAIAAVVGAIAFHAGQATTAVVTQAPAGTAIYRGYYGGGGWFFGFFPILFFVLLLVFLFRRPWGRGYGHGAPHWHDHAHGGTPTQPPAGPTNQPPAV